MKQSNLPRQAKITTLTPVFVGTGNIIDPICFICSKNKAERYSMEDLLVNLPPETLLNTNKIAKLAAGSDSKRDFYSIFQTKISPDVKPLYSLRWDEDDSLQNYLMKTPGNRKSGSYEIREQCKALSIPIIPGSSLKGAIECAFKYELLIENSDAVKKNLERFCETIKRKWIRTTPDIFYLSLIYGIDQNEAERRYGDFIRDLYGCLYVRDISFSKMTLLTLRRYPFDEPRNTRSKQSGQPMGLAEHISDGDIVYGDYPFQVNHEKVKLLKLKYVSLLKRDRIVSDLLNRFASIDYLLKAIADYSYDMSQLPMPEYLDLSGLQKVYQCIDDQDESKGRVVLRIGQNTSYFFKTVSKFFLDRYPDIFIKYFDTVFSPGKHPKKGCTHNPNEFPDTFTFAVTPYEIWPTGFIQIEYADEN